MYKFAACKHVRSDPAHKRFFFDALVAGRPRQTDYRPLNATGRRKRNVVWQPVSKANDQPHSLGTFRHKREVYIGIIGTSQSADLARRYYEQASHGVDGDQNHTPFPGCRADRCYRCELVFDPKLVELITRSKHQDILSIRNSRQRFEKLFWDDRQYGKSPHLTEDLSEKLISMVMDRYKAEQKLLPKRVVVHKTSRYEPQERLGFEAALKSRGCLYDLVSLTPWNSTRLLRAGQYPPLRGTLFSLGDISYLYTSGYLPTLGRYPHGHVPSPLQIADHVGDNAKFDLLREVMTLTKMTGPSLQPTFRCTCTKASGSTVSRKKPTIGKPLLKRGPVSPGKVLRTVASPGLRSKTHGEE